MTLHDAPTWLIFESTDGATVWCRAPRGTEPLDLVVAERIAGGHADPSGVLTWLEGKRPDPWYEDFSHHGEQAVVEELGRRLLG